MCIPLHLSEIPHSVQKRREKKKKQGGISIPHPFFSVSLSISVSQTASNMKEEDSDWIEHNDLSSDGAMHTFLSADCFLDIYFNFWWNDEGIVHVNLHDIS